MRYKQHKRRHRSPERKGTMIPVVAMVMPVLLIFMGFSLNLAYMELARTQLRLTCDSAAKAALVNFGATESQSTAISFAQGISANNQVCGKTLSIPTASFIFGNATKNSGGVYAFTSGGTPINSVQVTGSTTLSLPFASLVTTGSFAVSEMSYATRICHDIVLVLDRSASMSFDLSGNEFVYPTSLQLFTPLQCYFTPPAATGSRWAALISAVDSFISIIEARNLNVHVALVTYSENYTLGLYSSTEATLDVPLTATYSSIEPAMNAYTTTPLLGDTNISAGLAIAQSELTGSLSRTTADRTIILLTDGVATTGNTNIPSITASYLSGSSIVTHVITFGGEAATGTVEASMMSAAADGNGMFFNAATAAQLTTAFTTIADSLPAVLVK